MARPDVTVVMPFAGDSIAASSAALALGSLRTQPGDVLILADNSGTADAADGITVVRAEGERSPARARNAGAARAHTDWILFIDADCVAPAGLLGAYFAAAVDPGVGALAGEVVPAPGAVTLASRYAGARNFLRQEAHLAHGYRPRAVAANLMVRRAAFEQVGGFYEGLRAAEDTDFSWRLQAAGWRLELRREARVEHRYRATIGELRAQWRGYAAGRAWLARRYDGFQPEPALLRAVTRTTGGVAGRLRPGTRGIGPGRSPRSSPASAQDRPGRIDRARFLAIDALLGVDELAGFALSNRPVRDPAGATQLVLIADRFPTREDPLVDFARTVAAVRVEASARPEWVDADASMALRIDYREDDGAAERLRCVLALLIRHPLRTIPGLRATRDAPSLWALAPAAVRLAREPGARVHALGGGPAAAAARVARLAGRSVDGGPQT